MLNSRELDQKIDELFSFRCLPWMVKISKIRHKEEFLAKLKRLQTSIYQLDHTLESNWKVPKKQLKDDWKSIHSNLKEFGIKKMERERLCRPIRQYERHELRLRRGKTPMDLPMQYLYFYKSCDVKLMRDLIYRSDNELDLKLSRRDWYTFDLITEVNDDIDDIYEDVHTYNGNRLLFEIHTKGRRRANLLYREFLNGALEEFQDRRTGALTKAQKKVKKLTLDIGFDTLALLKKKLKGKKISRVSKARVLKKVY